MRRKKYYEEFGHDRDKPKFKERVIAFILTIVPKIGPFKVFKFKEVDRKGEKQFIKSFDTVMNHYASALSLLSYTALNLPNKDFDTGKRTVYGEYELTDKTYDDLLEKLQANKFVDLTAPLKENILSFYSKADTALLAKNKNTDWQKTKAALYKIEAAIPKPPDSLKVKVDNKTTITHFNN
jgi:hypothetical protein